MGFSSLVDIWSIYDIKDCKSFCAQDILSAINQLPQAVKECEQCRYEALAFSFLGNNGENEWGSYYRYQSRSINKETGEIKYIPDISDITSGCISYWEQRAAVVVNPLLKMRYTGLVLDFKKRITNIQPDYNTIKLANVEAILDVVEGEYSQYEYTSLELTDRAMELATRFKNPVLIHHIAQAYYDKYQQLGKGRLSNHFFYELIKYRTGFSEYEEEIVDDNMKRLTQLEKDAIEEGTKTDKHVHGMASLVDLFCEYYHLIGENDKIENLLDRLLVVIKLPISVRGGMWGQGMLVRMQNRYRKYGFDNKANSLYVDIANLGSNALKDLHKIEHSFTLNSDDIEAFLKRVMSGSHKQRLARYITNNLPNKERTIKRFREHAEAFPLEAIISTVALDANGNAVSRVGEGKNPEEQRLHFFMYEEMQFESVFIHMHIEELKRSGDVTVKTLMALFDGCPLVNESNKDLLQRGFEAYLKEDHIVCCHLLIPQFEAMIRLFVAQNGGIVLRQGVDPSAGDEYCSLDSLLDSKEAKQFLDEDILTYFKVLFVSHAGWNLRNRLCHGLIPSLYFSSIMSDRIVHATLVLSQCKKNERPD